MSIDILELLLTEPSPSRARLQAVYPSVQAVSSSRSSAKRAWTGFERPRPSCFSEAFTARQEATGIHGGGNDETQRRHRFSGGEEGFRGSTSPSPGRRGGGPRRTTVRNRFWKNEAAKPGAAERWGAENLERMRKGRPPQRYNPDKGGIESMELSHEPIPLRERGRNLVPRWPQDHGAVDPFRHPGYWMVDSSPTLAERFKREMGSAQEVEGVPVHNMYRRTVSNGARLCVRRLRALATPVQGIRLKLNTGTITVNGVELKDVVLWADTAPTDVEVICNTGESPEGELRVWNCWRDPDGTMQAWLGDAGIVVEEADGRILLRCSSGAVSPARASRR